MKKLRKRKHASKDIKWGQPEPKKSPRKHIQLNQPKDVRTQQATTTDRSHLKHAENIRKENKEEESITLVSEMAYQGSVGPHHHILKQLLSNKGHKEYIESKPQCQKNGNSYHLHSFVRQKSEPISRK